MTIEPAPSNQPKENPVQAANKPSLDRLFLPETIAVVGASDRPGSAGLLALSAIRKNFVGTVRAVNPTKSAVMGEIAYPSIRELPAVPDLAVLAIPGTASLEVVRECVELGVGGVLLFGSGFAEAGAEGAALQAELATIVEGTQTRLLGPNSLGFCDAERGTLATFLFAEESQPPNPGPLALVSQSGAIAEQLIARAEESGIGMNWMISTGNELNVNLTAGFEFLLERDSAEIIILFAESIKDPMHFMAAARRARDIGKPVIVIKTGRSEAGARAAVTHTASMAGPDRVFNQACRDLGLVRVNTVEEIIDVARVLASGRRATGSRLGIVSASGGGGVLAADLAEDAGLGVPILPEADQAKVRVHIPTFGSATNPIDVTSQGADDQARFQPILEAVVNSADIDAVTCVYSSHGPVAVKVAKTIVEVFKNTEIPMTAVWGSPEAASLDVFREAGFPYFTNPRNAVQALAAVARVQARTVDERPVPPLIVTHDSASCGICNTTQGGGLVLESDAQAFLTDYGVSSAQSRTVTSADAAAEAAAELGGTLVMKIVSEAVPHREKAGGITLNVSSEQQARDEFVRLGRIVPDLDARWAVLIQQQLPRGLEIVVGTQRDLDWGVTVLVGIGGTQTELINRSALRLAPVSSAAARDAVTEVFGNHLNAETTDAVAAIIRSVCDAMEAHPRIDSIDVNPLIVTPKGLIAVDGLISLH